MPYVGLYNLPYLLIVGLQIACAVHVFRTGRPYWWLYVIFFFPFVGSIVYLVVEVVPDMRRRGVAIELPASRQRKAERLIGQLKDELDYSDTVDTRVRLARACLEAGRAADAVAALQPCFATAHRDDPVVLFTLAHAYFHNGQHGEAEKMLAELTRVKAKDYPHERALLQARIHEATGRTDEALKEYADLARVFAGEEVPCRQALLLQKTGQAEKANEIFRAILAKARRADGFFRKRQQEWIRIARRSVA